MRKIALFVMTLMMAGTLFAYEPEKEFFKVVIYYDEEVEPQYGGDGTRRTFKILPSIMKRQAHSFYNDLLLCTRELASDYFSLAKREVDEEKRKKYENESINCIDWAINNIPFITKENYWTVDEYQYTKMFCKYFEKFQKAELKRQKQNRK